MSRHAEGPEGQELESSSVETVKQTGRGVLIITAAKVWFLITSAVIQLGLPVFLGSPEAFGVYKIVTEAMSLLNMVMITGTLQAVSKRVSEQPERVAMSLKAAIRLQFFLGVPLAVGYGIGAPWVAAAFNDAQLIGLIRLSSLIVLFYAFYAIFVGTLNGLKMYVRQAALDISFATLKTFWILILVFLGFGVVGAISGFVTAAGVICVAAGVWTYKILRGMPKPTAESGSEVEREGAEVGDVQKSRRLLIYLLFFMLYTVALNAVMRVDLFVLKSVVARIPDGLTGMGLSEDGFVILSNRITGLYGAVLNIARIPYQGIIAITFVIFPMISEASFKEDRETTQKYIRTTLRYCTLLTVAVSLLLMTQSAEIIEVLYTSTYGAAAEALTLLSLSIIFFTLLYVAMTILMSSGHLVWSVVLMVGTLVVSGAFSVWLIGDVHQSQGVVASILERLGAVGTSGGGSGALAGVGLAVEKAQRMGVVAASMLEAAPVFMVAAAKASLVAMGLGCVATLGVIYGLYRATIPVGTLLRTVVGGGVTWGVSTLWHAPEAWMEGGRLVALVVLGAKGAVLGLVFVAVLAALGEFTREDVRRVLSVLGRG